uniref:Uncharacterized protein n=1 Tax=Anguilla anguilla TaxID=7936 RepID=A0A0E9VQJ2_ANGAN
MLVNLSQQINLSLFLIQKYQDKYKLIYIKRLKTAI